MLLLLVAAASSTATVLTADGDTPWLPTGDARNVTDYLQGLLEDALLQSVRAALLAEDATKNHNHRAETSAGCPWRTGLSAGACGSADLRHRSADGTCNNALRPHWGRRGAALRRLLPPDYADGVGRPRGDAPPPAVVAAGLRKGSPGRAHTHVTSLVGAWGELLRRDLAQTFNPETVSCCQDFHPECNNATNGVACLQYMRSVPTVSDGCKVAHREQMNLATAYLDGSDVYGSTAEDMLTLRSSEGGQVLMNSCRRCRGSSPVGLLYSVLLLEHNRIASALATINKHWDDEMLFQEARRIVIAQMQHLTYNEFLPTVLGELTTENNGLKLKEQGYYDNYSSTHHAGIMNSVATSALHYFSLMIPTNMINATEKNVINSDLQLIQAMLTRSAEQANLNILTQGQQGWAKGAYLIQMSRDHGIPSYDKWLKLCNPKSAAKPNFSNISYLMSQNNIDILQDLYGSLGNVDLMAGALLEKPADGSLVGPTFACLLAYQFTSVRNSDRFWYENDLPPASFTRKQLEELRKVTLAGLLCDNVPGLTQAQSQAFFKEDPYLNVRLSCDLQPTLDLSAWHDESAAMQITDELLMQAIERAEADVKQRRQLEYQSWSKRGSAVWKALVNDGDNLPGWEHQRTFGEREDGRSACLMSIYGGADPKSPVGTAAAFSKANGQALRIANMSLLLEFASQELINSLQSVGLRRGRRQVFDQPRDNVLGFPPDTFGDDFSDGLQSVDVSPFLPAVAGAAAGAPESECEANDDRGPCDTRSPFRTITGHCNNLRNPALGKSLTTFARLLPAAYENSISHPRLTSVSGVPLPSPRIVSTQIHADISNLHNRYSLMLMQFAQFLDHDITFTPVHKGFFASIPDCRSCDSAHTVHPECMPIPVPRGDHHYPQVNHSTGERLCFPFMRSLPGQQHLGPRDQINQNSAFVDASQVYGEHLCQSRGLRGFGGRLNVTRHPVKGKDLLPQSSEHPECKAPSGFCFIAGDGRASEQPALTAIHTLFMREHNRLADGLRALNPHWNDELLFQHARRILTAAEQHISYNEFLPRVLGWNAVNLYELKLRPQGFYKAYNPSCNPSIVNEFATAAFRIGHSLLRPHIPRMGPSYDVLEPPILLRDGFFKPDMIYQVHMIDEIIRGLLSTPMENMDQFVTGEITNHLFEDRRVPHSGVDLIALNIQRGRDHAIRPYNDYRALCNLKRASSFEDLAREIPSEVITRLKRIYASVDDIDLFPGGMSERPLQGGLVGPTFACIIGIQFRQLRKCDRFWYENDISALKFTEAQLAEIRKVTLSKILCENMDISSDMQRSAFDQPSSFLNPRVPCRSIPGIDLSAWRESPQGCHIGGRSVPIGESAFPSPCTSCICSAEGPQCASLRVTDCAQLVREADRGAVLRDDVCTAQCGAFLLQEGGPPAPSGPPSGPSAGASGLDVVFTTTDLPLDGPRGGRGRALPPLGLVPPPPRGQARSRQGRPPPPTGPFAPFKFTDLPFLG